jgi:hypothetical protein
MKTKINSLLGKRKSRPLILFAVMMTLFAFTFTTKDICSEINKYILGGDAQQISKYFHSTVDMSVLGQEGYFSKVQAVPILSDFFKNNPPKEFTVKQGGSNSENTKFSIGTYESATGSFKIYYVVKTEQEGEFIHKLTIEKK